MRYLSEEWISAANDAVIAAADTAPEARIVIDQIISGANSYRVQIGRNNASITLLTTNPTTTTPDRGSTSATVSDRRADACFLQTIETATAVATGSTDAHQAFLLGHIRFEGDVDTLIERRDAFGWLEATLAPVLAATTFD